MKAEEVKAALRSMSDPARAKTNEWFFKTGQGQYGEGDKFLGVNVPNQRIVAKRYKSLPLHELAKLFRSNYHEHRLTACLICVHAFSLAQKTGGEGEVHNFYLSQLRAGRVNNWDLIDTSAPQIMGGYLLDKPRDLLYELADTNELWQQRAAIMATLTFIKAEDFGDTLKLAELMLKHPHDLIQKAVGWMLREVGNRDRAVEEEFLKSRYQTMPRTMLRYAIEKFPEPLRQDYLNNRV